VDHSILHDRLVGLAGVFQAAELVQLIATNKPVDMTCYENSLKSIFTIHSNEALDIYQNWHGLEVGVQAFSRYYTKPKPHDMQTFRYALGILQLTKRFLKHKDMPTQLRQRIERVEQQVAYFGGQTHPNIIANLAEAYQQTLSTLPFRLMVYGNNEALKQQDTVNKVRALLLSGVRAAVLWQQKGGNLLWLFCRAKGYAKIMQQYLKG